MKTVIHVSPGRIRLNRKLIKSGQVDKLKSTIWVQEEDCLPALVKEAIIYGQDGLEAARVVYRAGGLESLPSVNVYIETENNVVTIKGNK